MSTTVEFDAQMVPIGSIKPYEKNPRKIGQDAIDAVMESLREFGWKQPIVVDKKNVVIVGHTRLLAAKALGWTEAWVKVADLTDEQARAYRIIDNKSGEKALWDFELLSSELKSLDMTKDVFAVNFSPVELDSIMQTDWQIDMDKVQNTIASSDAATSKVTLECHPADKVDLESWLEEMLEKAPVEVTIKK